MKYVKVFKWLSVILVIAVMIPAIGCGKKEAQEPTPTPTATPTATTPAEPTGETGTLSSLTGDVTVMRQGTSAWIAAASGMKIGTGDSLKTGSDGYVLITFFDGSVMEVEADSEISVEELSVASGGSTTVRISQVLGNTVNRVENLIDSSSTYEVETLAGSAVVRGTIYEIHVDQNGRHTCTETQDENDTQNHYVDFTGSGVTVKVPEKMTSCCWEGGVPGSPFYTDPADDPLQYAGDGGGCSGGCCPPCYPINRFIDGFGDGAQPITGGFEGCICPCGETYGYGYCEEGYYCSGEGSFQCVPICADLGKSCQIGEDCCSGYCLLEYCAPPD
jgi:hypothetical protein